MAQKWAKIMASLALIAIISSVLWTWIMVIFQWWTSQEPKLTPEQIAEIQTLINSGSWNTSTWELNWTWNTIETN